MTLVDEWIEWHLTPTGWERGSSKTGTEGLLRQPSRPPTAVLTIRRTEFGSSFGGDRLVRADVMWVDADVAGVRALIAKHGPAPQSSISDAAYTRYRT